MHLLADIGGTNARFQLCGANGLTGPVLVRRCVDYRTINALILDIVEGLPDRPSAMILAVAGPVDGDEIALTNLDWRFSCDDLARDMRFEHCRAVNDFAAVAWSLPAIEAAGLHQIGGGLPTPGAAMVALGPGTGLGVAALVPMADDGAAGDWAVVSGEASGSSGTTPTRCRILALLCQVSRPNICPYPPCGRR